MRSYVVDGPAVVSFSGGRTSALMLRKILDVGLGEDVHVLFANTGKERAETLEFVAECARRWRVDVHWLERPMEGGFREVDQESRKSAARVPRGGDGTLWCELPPFHRGLHKVCTRAITCRFAARWWVPGNEHRNGRPLACVG